MANGLFEEYYPDGSILIKKWSKRWNSSKIEVYYKSGETLAIIADSKYMKIFNKDGSLVESYDADKNETILYQENGNPFILQMQTLLHIMKTMQFCLKLKTEKK